MEPRPLVQVSERVFVTTAALWATSSTVVVDQADALVVDPALTRREVESLAVAVRDRGWRVSAGFSTHPHWDHQLWNRALGDVPRWATATGVRTAAASVEHAHAECERYAPGHDRDYLTTTTALPDAVGRLPWRATLPVIEHCAHVRGHAALVADDVLVAGDMLSDTEVPLIDDAHGISRYRSGLDLLENAVRTHAIRVLVPGHGTTAVGASAIADRFAADRAYLDALESRAVQQPGPLDATIDTRITGEMAGWHAEQLAMLRAGTTPRTPGAGPSRVSLPGGQ